MQSTISPVSVPIRTSGFDLGKDDELSRLPTELVFEILRRLDVKSLCQVAQCNRRLYTYNQDDLPWKEEAYALYQATVTYKLLSNPKNAVSLLSSSFFPDVELRHYAQSHVKYFGEIIQKGNYDNLSKLFFSCLYCKKSFPFSYISKQDSAIIDCVARRLDSENKMVVNTEHCKSEASWQLLIETLRRNPKISTIEFFSLPTADKLRVLYEACKKGEISLTCLSFQNPSISNSEWKEILRILPLNPQMEQLHFSGQILEAANVEPMVRVINKLPLLSSIELPQVHCNYKLFIALLLALIDKPGIKHVGFHGLFSELLESLILSLNYSSWPSIKISSTDFSAEASMHFAQKLTEYPSLRNLALPHCRFYADLDLLAESLRGLTNLESLGVSFNLHASRLQIDTKTTSSPRRRDTILQCIRRILPTSCSSRSNS